jgi:hypothetical protein
MTFAEFLFDRGYDQYKTAPDLMLIEVWRLAFTFTDNEDDTHAFVEGYLAARKHRDEARTEGAS